MTDAHRSPSRRTDSTTSPVGELGRRAFLAGAAAMGAVLTVENVGGHAPAHAEGPVPDPIPLPLEWTLDGISPHDDHTDGDFDGGKIAFPAEEFPTGRAQIGGLPFDFPESYGPGEPNFLVPAGQTLELDPVGYAGLFVLGAAQNGAVDAPATVTYKDGSTAEVPLQLSDWAERPRHGEAIAIAATHRHSADSNSATPRVSIFLQMLPLDPTRSAVSITLPDAENARLIAATALPAVQGAAARPFSVTSTDLFVGTEEAPQQLARVELVSVGTEPVTAEDPATVTLGGTGVSSEPATVTELAVGARTTVEVGLDFAPRPEPGTTVAADASVSTAAATLTQPVDLVVAEPGWTLYMVNHFHYDAVWGSTQAEFTETNPDTDENGPAIALMDKFLRRAEEDPDFRFVLAELDYLKPYWAYKPQDRDLIRSLLDEGRLELVGGSYNEPNPNLTGAELTIRNVVYGMGYQRDVLSGSPESSWQLDVFGHDAQFPGICADAGLTSSAWARGPYHGAGPGDPNRMQFPSEFDWVSPSGASLLTHYMPLHYSAGWDMNSAESLEEAEEQTYAVFEDLKIGAATRNCLVPVGSDFTPPNRWVTDIQRDWNQRYVWPKFVSATAKDYFDAVREAVEAGETTISPQSRDMNPIFTGKDVSYIDTKQANREAETTLLNAEKYATLASLLGARYPTEAMDKAWRQLFFNAHHDAITGTESDQVYLDLVAGWREALDLADTVRDNAQDYLCTAIDTSGDGQALVVFNPMSWERTDVCFADVTFEAPGPKGLMLRDANGKRQDLHVDRFERHEDGTLASVRIGFLATVPGTGYATYHLALRGPQIKETTWKPATGRQARDHQIENDTYLLRVDPGRGGAVTRLYDKRARKEMLREGGVANELLAYDEYAEGPGDSGNPWVIGQKGGPIATSTDFAADVRVETSPIGSRIVVTGDFEDCTRRQEIALYDGVGRVDCTTRLDGFSASDRLTRVRFQTAVAGGMPVSETAHATIGRNHGFPNDDVRAGNTHTLDFPAHNWFEVGSTLRLRVPSGKARAVSVGELVVPGHTYNGEARTLVDALIRRGVTATTSVASAPRYGALAVDSNLPDARISVGGPEENPFTEQVLEAADPAYRTELDEQLAAGGSARVLVPAQKSLEETWVPGTDVRAPLALPVLIIAGADEKATREAVTALAGDIDASPDLTIDQPEALDGTLGTVEDYGVAVINRGIPSFTVETNGDAYLNVLRSSTRWPSGAWSDPPRATLPDGANFQTQHWSHDFHYSLVGHTGDWREGQMVRHGHEVNIPLSSRTAASAAGDLPAAASMLSVEPATVVLSALKPRGNPIASQGGTDVDLADGVTVRVYESHGTATNATVTLHGGLTGASTSTILEGDGEGLGGTDGAVQVPLDGFGIATVTGNAGMLREPDANAPELAPRHEEAQPIYSQYWRHNKGAAPLGYQPVTVRLTPEHHTEGGPYEFTVEVASEHTQDSASGTVQLVLPEGWTAEPAEKEYALAPGEVETFTVTVDPGSAGDGAFHVAARITDDFGAQEAVAQIDRGEIAEGADELGVELTAKQIRLLPGQRGSLEMTLSNPTGGEVRGEAQLISPYGSWHLTDEPIQGFAVPAGGEQVVTFDIAADDPGMRPGEWWVSVKVMHFGRVHFTPAIPLVVTNDPLSVSADNFAIGVGGTEEVAIEVLNIGTEPLSGELALEVPDGWTAEPSPQPFGPVGQGETLIVPVQVTAPADAEPDSFTLTATATAGDMTASSQVTARILPDRIQFAPGTPEEAYWMLDPAASITQTGLRFADNDRYWIYRFALPVETTAAMLTVELDNQYLVEVRADEGEWVEVLRETEEIRDGSNGGSYEADLTEHLGEQRIVDLRFSDSFPDDGWGVRLFDLVLEIVR